MKNNLLFINVPIKSTDYDIDNFLGNTMLTKSDGVWEYNTSIALPNNELKIIGELNKDIVIETNLDLSKKWIVIEILNF